MKSILTPSSCIETNHKWLKDLNLKPEALKLPEANTDSTPQNTDAGKDFVGTIPVAMEPRLTIDNRDLMELLSFCSATEKIKWRGNS